MSTAEEKKPETEMPVDKPEQKGELKLNHPKPFTGKREDLKKFLQDVKLYLHVNDKIYDLFLCSLVYERRRCGILEGTTARRSYGERPN